MPAGDDCGDRPFGPASLRCSPWAGTAQLAARPAGAPLGQGAVSQKNEARCARPAQGCAARRRRHRPPARAPDALRSVGLMRRARMRSDCEFVRESRIPTVCRDRASPWCRVCSRRRGAGFLIDPGRWSVPSQSTTASAKACCVGPGRVLVCSREAQGGWPARTARFVHQTRGACLSGAPARARSEFAAQASRPSIAGNPCAAGASTRTRPGPTQRAFARAMHAFDGASRITPPPAPARSGSAGCRSSPRRSA